MGTFAGDDWRAIDMPLTGDEIERCLWSTKRFGRRSPALVRNVRALVHGHLSLAVAQQRGNVFYIDTGGWMSAKGHFTFVDLASLELIRGPGPNASANSKRNR
jgi:serine/threonine protein phosphatase 1